MRPALLLPLALAACAEPATPGTDPTEPTGTEAVPPGPADALGPWGVGTETDAVAARGGETLPLQVWWPSDAADGEPYSYEGVLIGEARAGAPVACDTPRPVVLFSHGNGGVNYQSVFLTEHLASHGYLVAAPDHVGNTTLDLDTVPRTEVALRRPHDIADTFDHLVARSADPSDPLAGCVDPDAGYALTGHSFGGWTTLVTAGGPIDLDGLTTTCASGYDFLCGLQDDWAATYPGDDSGDLSDPRVWAAIPLAPVGAGSLGGTLGALDVPTLIIGGRIDLLTPWDYEVKPLYQALEVEPRGLAGVFDAGHYHFTDFCLEGVFPNCGGDALPVEETHRYTVSLVTAWLRMAAGEDAWQDWLPAEDPQLSWRGSELP